MPEKCTEGRKQDVQNPIQHARSAVDNRVGGGKEDRVGRKPLRLGLFRKEKDRIPSAVQSKKSNRASSVQPSYLAVYNCWIFYYNPYRLLL